jgi:hypothetical protein
MAVQLTKGRLGDITFQLNPTQITDDDGGIWAEINSPGMESPITQFSYGKAQTFTFELYMNKRHRSDVDIPASLAKLKEYRKAKTPVMFTYMGYACKVVIIDCPINVLSLTPTLVPTEVTIPITLKRYE